MTAVEAAIPVVVEEAVVALLSVGLVTAMLLLLSTCKIINKVNMA